MLLCELRNIGIKLVDKIRGGDLAEAIQTLKKYDNMDYRDDDLQEYKRTNIVKLLNHATGTVPFYKDYKRAELSDFPVVNKNMLRDKTIFLSASYREDELIKMSTSGSTGTPFVSYQDRAKKKFVNAEVVYYSEKAGYKIGYPLYFFRSSVNQNEKSKLKQFIQNQPLISCNDLSLQGIRNMLKHLQNSSEHAILLTYASTLDAMVRHLPELEDILADINLTAIISISEMLCDNTREKIEEAFCCRCYSRYSNQEQGILSQDEKDNNIFIVNEASYHVEIFKMDEDIPADKGEIGRIVITDLKNYAMPFIRYDTGDVGSLCSLERKNGIRKTAINDLGGRKCDLLYGIDGELVSIAAITRIMWYHPDILQYQLIQETAESFTFKLNAEPSEERERNLDKALRNVLGNTIKLNFEYEDEIPVLSSGKRRKIVNNMNK